MKRGRSLRDRNWHAHARVPVPPEHPAAKTWAEPDEVIYPGLAAIDWQQYLDTIWQRGRRKRVREATRTLFLTNRRVIVVDETRKLKTDLPLADVYDVSVGIPPGAPEGMPVDEAVVQVAFRAGRQRRVVGWSWPIPLSLPVLSPDRGSCRILVPAHRSPTCGTLRSLLARTKRMCRS